MSEKEEWCFDRSAGQMGFKAPEERPENYQIRAQIMGRDVEFVSKKMYIEALDRAHSAEEQLEALRFAWQSFNKYLGAEKQLEALRFAWQSFNKYLGAAQSQDASPSVERT